MLIAITVAIAAIALGTVLGLLPGSSPRAAGPFRTGAMVTSIAVVLGQLLPESLSHIGMWGLCVFVLGYMAPRAAERLATWMRKPACSHEDAMCTDLGLELGFVGLLLHSVGDGVGLGLYSGPLHQGHGHYDVLFAIAGHTVPVAALVALAFKTHRGTSNAIVRAVAVAFAMIIGMVLANALSVSVLVRVEPWLTAIVSGLLLHIVTHGWNVEGETTLRSRVGDFVAIGIGILLVAFGGHSHGHGQGQVGVASDMRHAMGDALVELGLETAPMLLLGLAIAAVLQTQGARIPASVLSGGSRLAQTLRGALVGAPLPVCACGILPVAHGLRRQGATAAFVVTFLLATPELGVDTLALSVRFLGWPLSLARLFGGLAVAMIAGYVLARVADGLRREEHQHEHESGHGHDHPHRHAQADHAMSESGRPFATAAVDSRPFVTQVLGHFDELLYHVGAWTVVGLLAAAYLQATVSNGSLSMLNIAGMAAYGTRATFYGIGALVLTTWTLAALANVYLPAPVLAIDAAHEHSHGALSYACAALLISLLGRAVWRNGLRVWLGSLGETMGHDHAHDHAH
jgi:uncharacterized protein